MTPSKDKHCKNMKVNKTEGTKMAEVKGLKGWCDQKKIGENNKNVCLIKKMTEVL